MPSFRLVGFILAFALALSIAPVARADDAPAVKVKGDEALKLPEGVSAADFNTLMQNVATQWAACTMIEMYGAFEDVQTEECKKAHPEEKMEATYKGWSDKYANFPDIGQASPTLDAQPKLEDGKLNVTGTYLLSDGKEAGKLKLSFKYTFKKVEDKWLLDSFEFTKAE